MSKDLRTISVYLHTHTHVHSHAYRYVKQCEIFLLDGRISCEMFASECLPTLIHLARDKVPNVRIAVAKMLKESVLGIGMVLPACAWYYICTSTSLCIMEVKLIMLLLHTQHSSGSLEMRLILM